jgi:hypothetical protein
MILFASTITLSAFLLFLVQPIIAKQILPWFGGSAAVWTTCMVFFQLVLLAGYFYSDVLIRRAAPRRQAIVHTVLLVASLALLPIVPAEAFKPTDASAPIGRILLLLAVTIGLPYLMLSTTGPLVQAWFARRWRGGQVYRLYALSNVASMLALIAYPPLIEPNASTMTQSVAWSVGYAVFAVLAIAAAWAGTRHAPLEAAASAEALGTASSAPPGAGAGAAAMAAADAPASDAPAAVPAVAGAPAPAAADASPSGREQALWLALSALGSVLLLAITTHITQNVASIPFLWVLPLALYLLTFILCFDGEGWYRRRIMVPLAALMAMMMLFLLSWRPKIELATSTFGVERDLLAISYAVPVYAIGLFVCCMFCHGELVARKPVARHLTRFYLMVSLGGALGGLFVGLLAPNIYSWYWELPVALVLVTLFALFLSRRLTMVIAAICLSGGLFAYYDYASYIRGDAVAIARNFYGTLRVKSSGAAGAPPTSLRLVHGVITHGEQYTDPQRRMMPTTYYGETAGIGRTILSLREIDPARPQRVGLVGMGVGTLAAYGRAGDAYRFYEINPLVVDWARNVFGYLGGTPATVETALGDARLVLEREQPQRFDVLAIDAFSSDSIPVHLLTREAMELYRRHVNDDGAIAIHISNRYLDLRGVVQQLAEAIGWRALWITDDPPENSHLFRTDWVIVTNNMALFNRLSEQGGAEMKLARALRPWTDDYNNLFDVLR